MSATFSSLRTSAVTCFAAWVWTRADSLAHWYASRIVSKRNNSASVISMYAAVARLRFGEVVSIAMLLWRRWVAEQREEGGGHYAERLLREMAEDAIDFCLASSMYYSVLHALLRLILCHGCRLSVAFHSCTPVARGEWLSVPLRLFDGERSVVRMTFSVALDCRRRDALIEMLCSGTCNRLACLVSACTLLRVASGSTRAIFFLDYDA